MHAGMEGAAPQSLLLMIKDINEESNEESESVSHGGGSMVLQVRVRIRSQ